MKTNMKYFLAFIVIFIIEVYIALFIHDSIIRPFVGDILVVVLMYTFIRACIKKTIRLLPIYLFVFSSSIEMLQYFKVLTMLNLQHNTLASIIFGATFDIKDILCYLVGSIVVFVWERLGFEAGR